MESSLVDKRRDLVRHLAHTGLSASQIVEKLDKHFELFPSHFTYSEKKNVIQQDIIANRAEVMAEIAIEEFDVKQKHAEYIAEQRHIYHRAMQDGDYSLAMQASKNKAKAYGIQTDEPIVIKTDLMTMLRSAQDSAKKKKQAEIDERKVIDVTPEPPEQREKVPATAILTRASR